MLRDEKLSSAIGVEISEEACELAQKTKTDLSLANFTVLNADLNQLKGKIELVGKLPK
jgi:methylase of polypeptide subunit release factors